MMLEEDKEELEEPYEQIIKLTDKKILFLQQIQGFVTLVCSFNDDYMDRKGVIEYNINVFRETFQKMIDTEFLNKKKTDIIG